MIFDTHAHYDDKRYDGDREKILGALPNNNIEYVLNVSADLETVKSTIDLAKEYPYIYATVGVHPHYVKDLAEKDATFLEKSTKNEKVVAIGEIGLDYYRDLSPRIKQKEWFEKQLDLAKKTDLPVVIHTRDAIKDTYDILKTAKINKGIIHAYSGSVEMAEKFVTMGFHLGIGGVLTYDNVKYLPMVVEAIPLEFLVLETDAPYLTPVPHRGKRNTSQFLSFVVDKISHIKQISPETVEEITSRNAKTLFDII